ncbi:M50 family metallopeptidase [Tumebacillus sp. ITR2]|uniref:M50 family metallopeptidase n=1 Tax=Tumebacillus amylolyticus TaxID=2801339 RepID=A0ABS1JD85_9BACL|nr:M50 family metallopeptidase [Tumebacillus amylolyticus]MBL0388200.1 M50 family metallopeptidase [Tumebacillus amylolyticus]
METPMQKQPASRKNGVWSLAGILLVAFVLMRLPILGTYLLIVNTMIHESGHALMALLSNGKVVSMSLFLNTEGVTWIASASRFGQILTSLAGYVFSSVAAYLFFWPLKQGRHHLVCYILLGFIAGDLLLWVRNLYGIIWLLTFGALLIALLRAKSSWFVRYGMLFICGIVLVDSIWSALQVLELSLMYPYAAGDATNLSHYAILPTFVWGLVFFLQSLFFGWQSVRMWLR